jgi:predicted RNase H-like HicB family nuclease
MTRRVGSDDRRVIASALEEARLPGGQKTRLPRARSFWRVSNDDSCACRRGSGSGIAARNRARPRTVSREGMAAPVRYLIDLERDEAGWWVATAKGVAGCHTQGRSIRQAMSRVREVLEVCVGDAVSSDQLEPCIHLSDDARRVIARYETACKRLEHEQTEARLATAQAVETLVDDLSLSVRDAGEVLGLSHQRVSQLAKRGSVQ